MSNFISLLVKHKFFPVPSKPKTYIDVLKLLAIFLVLFNHSGTDGFAMYTVVQKPPVHQLLLVQAHFVKIAVPLFFMCSGALLLGREEPYGKLFRRRFLHFALILVIASLIDYNLFVRYKSAFALLDRQALLDFLSRLYRNDISFPFWYMYSYLSMMLMLPFLRKIAVQMKQSDFFWLLGMYQIACLLPVADFFFFRGRFAHTSYFDLFIDSQYVFFALIGYFIENRLDKKFFRDEVLLGLMFASLATMVVSGYVLDWYYSCTGDYSGIGNSVMAMFTWLPTVAVFMILKKRLEEKQVSVRKAQMLSVMSACTFGTYLFELPLRLYLQPVYKFFSTYLGRYLASCVYILTACAVGIILTFIWKLLWNLVKGCFGRFKHTYVD